MTDEKKALNIEGQSTSSEDNDSTFWNRSAITTVRRDIKSEAVGRWPFILASLGINSKYLTNRHGPCPSPACGGHDRFRFDDREGRGTFICNQMDGLSGDGFRLIQHVFNVSFREAITMVEFVIGGGLSEPIPEPVVRPKPPMRDTLDATGKDIWAGSVQITGSPAQAYFDARKIYAPLNGVRYLPATNQLVTLISRCNGRGHVDSSLQFTPLTKDCKARSGDRKFLAGHSSKGHAILKGNRGSKILAIAEGMETAMTLAKRLTNANVWACLTSGNLAQFKAPDWVEELHIAMDNDKAGENATTLCSALNIGIRTIIHWSPVFGEDLNDYLMRTGNTDWSFTS